MIQTLFPAQEHFRHRITVEEFHRMHRAGVLEEGRRFELLEGEIYTMDAMDDPHVAGLSGLDQAIQTQLNSHARRCVRIPIVVHQPESEPQPDLTLLRLDSEIRRKPRVEEVLAVIEIADSSLNKDRGIKQRVYAAAGIPEYWIVNVNEPQLEVYRTPGPSAYKLRQTLEPGEMAQFAAFPGVDLQWW